MLIFSSCGVRSKVTTTNYSKSTSDSISSFVMCRAVGGSLNVNKLISHELEKIINIHFDTIIGHDELNELLHENEIYSYNDYTKVLISKISQISKQRFVLIPRVIKNELSNGDISEGDNVKITYTMYDSKNLKRVFVINASIKEEIFYQELAGKNSSVLNDGITLMSKDVAEKLMHNVGKTYYNKYDKYEKIK